MEGIQVGSAVCVVHVDVQWEELCCVRLQCSCY